MKPPEQLQLKKTQVERKNTRLKNRKNYMDRQREKQEHIVYYNEKRIEKKHGCINLLEYRMKDPTA